MFAARRRSLRMRLPIETAFSFFTRRRSRTSFPDFPDRADFATPSIPPLRAGAMREVKDGCDRGLFYGECGQFRRALTGDVGHRSCARVDPMKRCVLPARSAPPIIRQLAALPMGASAALVHSGMRLPPTVPVANRAYRVEVEPGWLAQRRCAGLQRLRVRFRRDGLERGEERQPHCSSSRCVVEVGQGSVPKSGLSAPRSSSATSPREAGWAPGWVIRRERRAPHATYCRWNLSTRRGEEG
jgi:hypothetical protein